MTPQSSPANVSDKPALRQRAEERVEAAESTQLQEAPSPEAVQRSNHELHVHQVELEMQNEELRRAQAELEEARARYFDLYDLAPVGYCTLSEKGLILEANLTAATLLGLGRGALLKQPLTHFILNEDQDVYYQHHRQLLTSGMPQVCEFRMLRANAPPFWARLEASVAQDADGMRVCRVVLSDITTHKQAEEQIQAALAEKEVLLKEVYHRVKNNLQLISSLLELQAGTVADPQVRIAFQNCQGRIRAIARVHERLYQSPDLVLVDMQAYIQKLAEDLRYTYGADDVTLHVEASQVKMDINRAIPCGLIINELVSNALKYAFPERGAGAASSPKEIQVTLRSGSSYHILRVSDNGIGLPETLNIEMSPSLGLRLVSTLARQVKGHLEVERAAGQGTAFKITFIS